jgi:hypothetical protein
MSRHIHFKSRFFDKEDIRAKEDWLNEHFAKGYVVVELQEIEAGYFAHLAHAPDARLLQRARFFHRGTEETMDDWITQKVRDGWNHNVHATRDGYWVIIHKEDEETLPPLRQLLLIQLIELWWLWLIGTVVFGWLYFTS